jgi:hypothetical protein
MDRTPSTASVSRSEFAACRLAGVTRTANAGRPLARIRRRRLWLWALLPLALPRLLIPLGFMPGGGGLMLCSAYAPAPAAALAMSHDMPGMDMSTVEASADEVSRSAAGGGTPGHGQDGGGDHCPFAASAAGMAPGATPTVPGGPDIHAATPPWPTILAHSPSILRAQGARGPPAIV